MVHWAWLIAAAIIGIWVGELSSGKFQRGFLAGLLGVLAAILWF